MSKNLSSLLVPCSLLSVDSPKRRQFLEDGVPKQLHENILGHGSYGTVIKAIYKDKQVAVKVIDNMSPEKMATIFNESNVLGWQHENIIKILKIDSGPRQAIVIMERFPGQCLQHIIERVKMPLYHIICISIDVTNGLSYCHERNLLHLDVKPKNILVAITKFCGAGENCYQCKLCDFGSSMFIENGNKQPTVKGTIRYMAPELLKNERPTVKADTYSLGITMWQLKAGKDPFYWIKDNESVAYKVVKDNIRPDFKVASKDESYISPITISNCLCSHYGSDQRDSLIENLSPLTLTASPVQQPVHANRSPFSNLNKTFNSLTSRPMNKSPNSKTSSFGRNHSSRTNIPTIIINSNPKNENEDFVEIFKRRSTQQKEHVMGAYRNLYKKSWDANPVARPSCTAVSDLLKNLLKYFK